MDYTAACLKAIHNQGLDVVHAAFESRGIMHTIEQTGGFCMVLFVDVLDERLGIAGEGNGCYSVARYGAEEIHCSCDADGETIASGANLADVIRYAERFVGRIL